MDWTQIILAVIAVVTPVVGAFAYSWRKRTDAQLQKMNAQIAQGQFQAQKELEQVKADTQQALASSKSIEALTNTLVTMVEERRESTIATKENTAELKNFTTRMGDWDERQRLFFQTFGANTTAFNLDVTNAVKGLQTATSEAIGLLTTTINGMIPQVLENVTPLMTKLDSLLTEVQRTGSDATSGRDHAVSDLKQEIQTASEKILQEIHHLENIIRQASRYTDEFPVVSGDMILTDPDEVDIGTEFIERQPAGA